MVEYKAIVDALEAVFGKVYTDVHLMEGRPVVMQGSDLVSLAPSDVNCRTAYIRELNNEVIYKDYGGCQKTPTEVEFTLRFVLYDVEKFNTFDFLRMFEKSRQGFDVEIVKFVTDTDALYRSETNNRKTIRTKGWGYAAIDFKYAVDINLCNIPECL